MVENTAVERIIDSLAFEVEALPQNNVLEILGTSKATPLNVKIKVRKKNEAPFEHGIVSFPKLGQPKKRAEEIRLVNSDQTVISFNVFVDTEPDKKPAKKRKKFFGGCLSTEDCEDEPYVDSNRVTAARSSNIVTQNFGLSKTENVQDMQLQPRKPVMFLGNRCKPGGCLDPPLDEEIYSYEPKEYNSVVPGQKHVVNKNQKHDFLTDDTVIGKETLKSTSKDEKHKTSKIETKKEKIESDNISLESVFQADFIKSLSDAQYSDSIITYPTNEIADDIVDRPSNTNRRSDESRNTFSEFRESFFIPPKNASSSRNDSNAFKGILFQNFETYIAGRRNSDDKIFTKVSPEENTIQNLKTINDSIIINNKEKSSLGIDINKTKNDKGLQYAKEDDVTTAALKTGGLSNNSSEVQTKKYLELTKEDNVNTTVLKTETVLVTPFIAAAAMSKIKSDNDSDEIHSRHDNDYNNVDTECDSLNNYVEEKSNERSSKDKNTCQNNIVDDLSNKNKIFEPNDLDFNAISKEINNNSKEDLQSFDFILSKDKYDNFSKEYVHQSDDTAKDEISDMLTINDNYSTKDIAADIVSQIHSVTEENSDINSQISSNMEEDKRAQESSFKKENLEFGRISGNKDNIKEQHYSPSREPLSSLDIRATAAEEERRKLRLSDNEDNFKEQHYSTSKEQLSSLDIPAPAAEEERSKMRLSGNKDNIKEQHYFTSKEQQSSLDIRAPAAEEERSKMRLSENNDNIKEQHYSNSKEQQSSLDIRAPAAEEERSKLSLSGNEDNIKEQLSSLDIRAPAAVEERSKMRLSGNEDNIKEQLSSLDIRTPAADEERRKLRLISNEDNIKEQYYSTSKDQLSSMDIPAPAAKEERRKLFDTDIMIESQDANDNEYKKSLISSLSYNENMSEAQKSENAESNKYQDTVLTSQTFDQNQINSNLDNNTRYGKDKIDQHNTEDTAQFKEKQKAISVNYKVHDMINDSVIHKQYDSEKFPLKPTGCDVIKPKLEKLDNEENINKPSQKYDEYYKQSSTDNNFVNVDIAFYSFINDKNESVIKTFDTLKHINRQPQDNVTVIKSQIQLNVPRAIEIPIDNNRNITLEIKMNDNQKPSSIETSGPDTRKSVMNNKKHTKSQHSQVSMAEIEWFQDHLTAVYENQLLPLQTLISDLKKDVDILAAQQMWLKEIVTKSRMPKTLKLTLSNRKCVCFRK